MNKVWAGALSLTLLASCLVATGQIAGPTPASAASGTVLSPAAPIRMERFDYRTSVPTRFVRPVVLQKLVKDRWATIYSGHTAANGAYRFTVHTGSADTLRSYAGATKYKGKTYPGVATDSVTVRPVAQTASISAPTTATVGSTVSVVAGFQPVRNGRGISLEQYDFASKTWATIASYRTNAAGAGTFRPRLQPTAGRAEYRIRMAPYNGAGSVTSSPRIITVMCQTGLVYATTTVQVRATPSASARILGTLRPGSRIGSFGPAVNGWAPVNWRGTPAWVPSSAVSVTPPGTSAPSGSVSPTAPTSTPTSSARPTVTPTATPTMTPTAPSSPAKPSSTATVAPTAPSSPAKPTTAPTSAPTSTAKPTVPALPIGAAAELPITNGTGGHAYGGSYPSSLENPNNVDQAARPDGAYLYRNNSGNLVTVVPTIDTTLSVTTFTASHTVQNTKTVPLPAEFPLWGGFYAAPDGNFYTLTGQANLSHNDALDVVAISKFDSSWNLVKTGYIKGGASYNGQKGIAMPFREGQSMSLSGTTLLIDMSRYAYSGHQMNMMVSVDTSTMSAASITKASNYTLFPFTSHSDNQLSALDGNTLVTAGHGDSNPRGIHLGIIADFPASPRISDAVPFTFPGNAGDNETGATLTGLAALQDPGCNRGLNPPASNRLLNR